MAKIAGLTLAGFVAASVASDKVNLGPLASQISGIGGALLGTFIGSRRAQKRITKDTDKAAASETD